MTAHSLSEQIAAAAREMEGQTDPGDTMDLAVRLGVSLVRSAEDAGISLVHRGRSIDTPAATSDTVRRIDELQYRHDQGPCLDAIREEEVVYCRDITCEERWPAWARDVARETGVRSVMCFRLFTHEDTFGALNLYSGSVDGFDAEDRDHGLAIAAHTAIAISAASQIANLKGGMDSRTLIGQSQGILMERYGLDAQQAFALLVRVSSTSNTKLRDVAADITRTRHVPGL